MDLTARILSSSQSFAASGPGGTASSKASEVNKQICQIKSSDWR